MRSLQIIFLCAVALALSFFSRPINILAAEHAPGPIDAPLVVNASNHPLVWDSMVKKVVTKPNQTTNQFIFTVTNTAKSEVTINDIVPSCGCTVAKMPSKPWKLKSGGSGNFYAVVDFHGKFGNVTKTLVVDSSAGPQRLTVALEIPVTAESQKRTRNMEAARNDRQAVFKNDCATCHVTPALNKTGEEFYKAACAICHEAANRGSMVPDLKALNKKTYPKYWKYWLTTGGPFFMPSFAKEKKGFLDEAQIDALSEFLDKKFPSPTVIKPVSAK